MSARTALIVDDEAQIRFILQEYLLDRGWIVETVGTVREATERLSAAHYELLVLDVDIPQERSDDLLPLRGDAKVIRISGFHEQADGGPLLCKPFLFGELQTIIDGFFPDSSS